MKLTIENLTKKYGQVTAVNQMNVTLKPGIIGLLGANGSGKTTLLRMIVGVLMPNDGRILFNGIDTSKNQENFLSQIGYMPQHLGMYPSFKVEEFLYYMGAIKGLTKAYTTKRINELLPLVHLENERKKKIKALSGGMRQRLGIVQALLNDPAILILDEPTAGLDPKERHQFSRLLSQLSTDKVILISTHIVSDVEAIANYIMIMKNGSLLKYEQPQLLLQELDGKVKMITSEASDAFKMQEDYIICSQKTVSNGIEMRYIDEQDKTKGKVVEPSLNDVYLYYFKEES